MRLWAFAFGVSLLAACGGKGGHAADGFVGNSGGPGVTATIYDGYALIEDRRELDIPAGDSIVTFDDVPSLVDADSVSVAADGVRFHEQEVAPGAPTTEAILRQAKGRKVRLDVDGGAIEGILVAVQGAELVLDTTAGARLVSLGAVKSASVDGLAIAARAQIRWRVTAPSGGKRLVVARYRAHGFRWEAGYSVVFDAEDAHASLGAWIAIDNRSGGTLPAGSRLRLATPTPTLASPATREAENPAAYPQPPPAAPSGETHAYWTVAAAAIPDGARTQLAYVPGAEDIPVRRVLVYDSIGAQGVWRGTMVNSDRAFATRAGTSVDGYVEIDDTAASGLGKPLPAGKVRIMRRGADGRVAWIGDDALGHVNDGARIRLRLGGADDVVGTRKQVEFVLDEANERMVEEIEIVLENKSNTPRDVTVLERMARGDRWSISWSSGMNLEKDDARAVRWAVKLDPKQTQKFRYRVLYTW